MGDETNQFVNRFAAAVALLGEVAGERPRHEDGRGARRGAGAAAAGLGEALDAIEAVYETGTGGLRNWAEVRRQVLAQAGSLRRALDSGAAPSALRPLARDLLHLIEAGRPGR
ncbi:MAG: hypothetical protein HZB56_08720 [Deltaproteobacteria bacterium]|nr:hypothetical protein [Deltaproteobacteria bacterium]